MLLNVLECYTCICLGYGISHDVSDVAAQKVRPERSGDSHANEQGLSLPNKAVQRSLVRPNSAPPHRSPSSFRKRRNTVCKESGTYTSLHLSHTYMCMLALTLPHTQTYTLMHPHVSHKPLLTHKNTCTIRIHTQRHCQIMQLVVGMLCMTHIRQINLSHTQVSRGSPWPSTALV